MVYADLKKRIVKNSFWNFSSLMAGRLGGLIFTVILARFLLPEKYGLYSIVLSVAMIFFTFSDIGVNGTFARFIAMALTKEKKKLNAYYSFLLKIKIALSFVFSLALAGLAYILSAYWFKNLDLFLPLVVASFYIFIMSLESFYTNIFYSIERVRYAMYKEAISQTLRIILSVAVFYFIASKFYVGGVFAVLAVTSLLMLIFTVFYTKKLVPALYEKAEAKINKKRLLWYASFLTIASISSVFFSNIDAVILGKFVAPEFVGFYKAAFSLVLGVIGIMTFPNAVLGAVFAKINKKKSQLVFDRAFKYLIMITIPSIAGLIVLGKYAIRIIYGYPYLDAVIPLYLLSIVIFPSAIISLLIAFFSAKEKPQITVKSLGIASVINIVTNFVLISSLAKISELWAIIGASGAMVISWFVYLFAAGFILRREFNFGLPLRYIIKPFIASMLMSAVIIGLMSLIGDINLIWGGIIILTGIIVYFALMFLIRGIGAGDVALLKLITKR